MESAKLPKIPVTSGKVILLTLVMCTGVLIVVILALLSGTAHISLEQIFRLISNNTPSEDPVYLIVFRIRLPRIMLAGIAGFALSIGGVVFQAVLRNPLADPFILGVSSGSAFGAVVGILLGFSFSLGIPVMAFSGALFTIYLVMTLGAKRMGMESSTILLTGVIINAFFTAIIMFFVSTSSDDRLHTMLFWLYGDLSQSSYGQLAIILPLIFIGAVILYAFSRDLNLLTAGEETAHQLGVEVEKAKKIGLIVVSLMMGLVVAFSGLIGFVGLIVPHLARMIFGSDHRLLLPMASLGGGMFLIAADTLARTVVSPSELPVGVITAFIGAPFFVYLLKTKGSRWTQS